MDVVKAVFCSGYVDLRTSRIPIGRILLDSGALHGNYVSENFLHANGGQLYHLMEDADEVIVMADSTMKSQITKQITLRICVQSGLNDFPSQLLLVTFSILANLKHDMILGLPPVLMKELTEFFIARLQHAKHSGQEELSSCDALRTQHLLTITGKAEQKTHKSRRNTEELSVPSSSSVSPGKLQYRVVLPDSRNPSLRKRFEPRHEYKPSSPDGD